jgi:hypothetical protein
MVITGESRSRRRGEGITGEDENGSFYCFQKTIRDSFSLSHVRTLPFSPSPVLPVSPSLVLK